MQETINAPAVVNIESYHSLFLFLFFVCIVIFLTCLILYVQKRSLNNQLQAARSQISQLQNRLNTPVVNNIPQGSNLPIYVCIVITILIHLILKGIT